jgi:hypothetical protein
VAGVVKLLEKINGNNWLRGILTAMLLGVLGFMLVTQLKLMADISSIKASRWTDTDQRVYAEAEAKRYALVWRELSAKENRSDVPRPEVSQRLGKLESDIAEVKNDIKIILQRLP